jgi:beta-glucanase (GH16 family)
MRRSLVLVLALAGCGESTAVVTPPPEWILTWSDEFEGEAGSLPDPSRWTFDVGGSGWGNAQLEFDTARAENARLDGEGNLMIVARREAYEGREYTSARLKTEGLFVTEYGRIEARVLLPTGAGLWPAFWMLGEDFAERGWPECGEIDILEARGQDPRVVHGSLHGPGYFGGSPVTRAYRLPDDRRFDQQFSVFAVEWDPGRISWSVDGETYSTVAARDVLARGRWVFDHPFFLILNLAVGGNFVGPPDARTVFPQVMWVDHVRVFRRAS